MRKLLQILILSAILALLSACGTDESSSSATTTSSQSISGTDSVNLKWLPPTTRADGTYLPARELAGYRIYMGTSRTNLAPIVDLVNDNLNEHLVKDLGQGSYYFAITAYDTDGMESNMSQVVLITLT